MPVYNAEEYLAEAVRSILEQTFAEFEFIAVDDGSTDRSLEILHGFAAADPRLRIVTRPHAGIVGALNDGLAAAGGSLIARMDADDVSLPHRLSRQVDFMRAHPECVASGSAMEVMDPHGAPICRFPCATSHEEMDSIPFSRRQSGIFHPTAMMRTEAVRQVGGYRKQFEWVEDFDLWLRLAERGRLANLNEVLVRYRVHRKSVSHLRAAEQLRRADLALIEAGRRRGLENLPLPKTPAEPGSAGDCELVWIHWALAAGELGNARRLAGKRLRAAPFSKERWRLYLALKLRELPWRFRPTKGNPVNRRAEPLVSVIIPCYNQAHHLRGAVESALGQTYKQVEVIVVNDGATDATAEVAARFGDRIRYLEQENAGLAAARNAGLRHATGELVNFLDADDSLFPTALEHHVRAAAGHPEAAVFYGGVRRVDEEGNLLSEVPPAPLPRDVFHQLLALNPLPCHSVVVRRSVLDPAGPFDPDLKACEDWDLWLRLAGQGCRFVPVPEARVVYRRYPGSMSRDPFSMARSAGIVLSRHAGWHGFCRKCLESLRQSLENCRQWYMLPAFPELAQLEAETTRLCRERSWEGTLRRWAQNGCLSIPGLRQLVLALRRRRQSRAALS